MKKEELLNILDHRFLDDLYGYCYRRTSDSHEAEELCSEIVFAIVKAGNREGEIGDAVSFAWKIAHNVYADFASRRRVRSDRMISDDPHEILINIAEEDDSDARREEAEKLRGKVLYADRRDLGLTDDALLIAEMKGMKVFDADTGAQLGTLTDVIHPGRTDIYVIRTEQGEAMVPVVPEFVKCVDEEKGIFLTPIEGMFD